MSSNLANRIKRVSKELKRKHPCRVCFGRGKSVVSKIHQGDPEPPTPEGCPGCGEVTHYVIQYVHVPIIER